jgi:hypothetical protein
MPPLPRLRGRAARAALTLLFLGELPLGGGPRAAAQPATAVLAASLEAEAESTTDPPSFFSRHRNTLLIVTAAGAAASGVGAALVRRSANERYEEYEQTADPERIEDLYDEATELDNTAAALFIAAEALFVGALYLAFFVDPPAGYTPGITLAPGDEGAAMALEWRF